MIPEELRQLPLLKGIDSTVLTRHYAQNSLRIKRYGKGTTVHGQHEPCAALDIVLSGRLAAYSLSENGSAMTMFTFRKDSMIGANLLFGDRNAYPLNIYSISDCRLLQIGRDAVEDFLHHYCFVMRYVKSLSFNSQGMNRRITMMAQKTLRENLLDYLTQQSLAQKTNNVILPISKKQLADYLGVQRPSLFRELKRLKDEGALAVDNRVVTLQNIPDMEVQIDAP